MADAGSLVLAGKTCIVGFFVVAGLCNLTPRQTRSHIDRLGALGTPAPAFAFWAGLALQFTGCALIAFDWHARIGVLCLIAFTVAATAIFHRFWKVEDPVRRNIGRIMLLNNVGILGGLLLLLALVD